MIGVQNRLEIVPVESSSVYCCGFEAYKVAPGMDILHCKSHNRAGLHAVEVKCSHCGIKISFCLVKEEVHNGRG